MWQEVNLNKRNIMAEQKKSYGPFKMDEDTIKLLDKLAANRRPNENRPSMLIRLIWEEEARIQESADIQSAESQSAPAEEDQSAPEKPESQSAETQSASDDEFNWEA